MSFFRNIFSSSNSSSGAACGPLCSVCLVAVNPGDSFTDPSGCGHLLHLQCFMQVQSKFNCCPTCRTPFKIGATPSAPPMAQTNFGYGAPLPPPAAYGQPRSGRTRDVPAEEPLYIPTRTSTTTALPAPVSTSVDADADISVVITPEVPAAEAGSERRMFVNVSVVSQDCEVTEKSRVGVDLVMILDKSGSMGGQKESLLRNAVEFVIGELDQRDRLCTVAFDNRAHYEHGFIGMGPSGHARALESAHGPGLRAGGGTDIFDGLQMGVTALNARKVPNAVTTIFLLTDGIDNAHFEEKLALARHARAQGWFMFIFAFGNDHNADHLRAIAEAADSSYIFIDNLATVREAFGGAVGSQQGVAGKLLNLSIQASDPGVVIHRAVAGQYASNVAADGRTAIITYPNLLVGEKRDCCVELTLPAVSGSADSSTVLTATLTYTPAAVENTASTEGDVTVISPACTVARPAAISTPLPRNEIVDSQINRMNGIDAIARATALANQNKLEDARGEVTRAKAAMSTSTSAAAPSTQAMLSELEECMGRLKTTHEWKSVGMAEQMESLNVHKCQRGVYAKKSRYNESAVSSASAYSNFSSKACQQKASFF